jgi:hypothetical protein
MPRKFSGDFLSRPRGPSRQIVQSSTGIVRRPSGRKLGLWGAAAWWNTCGVTNLSSRLMAGKIVDRTGQRFGRLVVKRLGPKGKRGTHWWCECDCGRACVLVRSDGLTGGSTSSCGCLRLERLREQAASQIPAVGTMFGRWRLVAVVEPIKVKDAGCKEGWSLHAAVQVECACGQGRPRVLLLAALRAGHSKSCGCLQREVSAANGRARRMHGLRDTPEYGVWCAMRNRCYRKADPYFENYGGRGIRVCDSWRCSFAAFLQDMGPRPGSGYSIERIDNDGDYCRENCVWVTAKDQARNRRSTCRVLLDGSVMPLAEAAEKAGVNYKAAWKMMKRGERFIRVKAPA